MPPAERLPMSITIISADSVLGANGDVLSYNLFTYCSNNPVMFSDPSGHSTLVASSAVLAVAAVIVFMVLAYAVIQVTDQLGSIMVGGGTAVGGFSRIHSSDEILIMTLVLLAAAVVSQVETKVATREKTSDDDIVIYRWRVTGPEELVPRDDINNGLSFSTRLRPDLDCAMTTIGALNATGLVHAEKDGRDHVTVYPIGGTSQQWHDAGSKSVWTKAVWAVVTII